MGEGGETLPYSGESFLSEGKIQTLAQDVIGKADSEER